MLNQDAVPPGTYRIEADFPEKGAIDAGSITVVAGKTFDVRCARGFWRCRVE